MIAFVRPPAAAVSVAAMGGCRREEVGVVKLLRVVYVFPPYR